MREQPFIYDKFVTEKMVLCSDAALARNGLILWNADHICVFVHKREAEGRFGMFATFYNGTIDYTFEVSPSPSNPLLLKPSKERAVVECVLLRDKMDEGLLIEGLKTYVEQFWQPEKLYRAAEHFGLDKQELDYWLDEARNDYEV